MRLIEAATSARRRPVWRSSNSGISCWSNVSIGRSAETVTNNRDELGAGEHARDICTDSHGNIYVVGGTASRDFPTTSNAYDRTFHEGGKDIGEAGLCDAFVMKFSPDGRLIWSTLLGGSDKDTQEASIRVDAKKRAAIVFNTRSADMPTTEGAFSQRPLGDEDGYVALLTEDGSDLVYGTYVGGSGQDWAVSTHTLALDAEANAYVVVTTASTDFPVTPGAYSGRLAGPNDIAIVKLSPTGKLLRSTLVGGNGQDGADGIYVDSLGNVFFTGQSNSADFPTTPDAFQATCGGDRDAVVVLLSSDFERLVYSTYMGSSAFDTGRSACLGPQGELCVTGAANGPGWPVRNAVQGTFAGTNDGRWGNGDCIVARFKRTER